MTVRDLYEYALVELNKLEAPSLILEDYNYFINKAVQQYINLVFAKAEIDQQSTDDIRVLRTSTIITPTKFSADENGNIPTKFGATNSLFQTSYYVELPQDYMHLLNCVVEYNVNTANFKCYDKDDKVYFAARRLTPDLYPQILNNAYMRPMYKRPYYYINNYNDINEDLPTNTKIDNTDVKPANGKSVSFGATGVVGSKTDSYNRQANVSRVLLELRFGADDGIFTPSNLYIDYIKAPMFLRLTQTQINSTIDTSQVLEFPDYVCFEILNIFVRLLMENASDPRLQTNIPLNNTIVNPAQQTSQQS